MLKAIIFILISCAAVFLIGFALGYVCGESDTWGYIMKQIEKKGGEK